MSFCNRLLDEHGLAAAAGRHADVGGADVVAGQLLVGAVDHAAQIAGVDEQDLAAPVDDAGVSLPCGEPRATVKPKPNPPRLRTEIR